MQGINGLICIDLWESTPEGATFDPSYYQWVDSLPGKLSEFDFHSIINASYGTKIDYSDPSMYNTLLAHNWTKFSKPIMLELISTCNNFTMSTTMQDKVFGTNTFALYSIESFLEHVNWITPTHNRLVSDWVPMASMHPRKADRT